MCEVNLRDVLYEALRDDVIARVRREGDALDIGVTGLRNRTIGLVVHPSTSPDTIRVSDGGDSWWGLVMDGHADGPPTQDDRERIKHLCALYGVVWNQKECAIETLIRPRDRKVAVERARHVLFASAALDGWRAWYPSRRSRHVSAKAIMNIVGKEARLAGITVNERARVQGKHTGRRWFAPLLLEREAVQAAVLAIHDKPNAVVERLTAWWLDTEMPAIAVVPPEALAKVEKAVELRQHIVPVPRTKKAVGDVVIQAGKFLPHAA